MFIIKFYHFADICQETQTSKVVNFQDFWLRGCYPILVEIENDQNLLILFHFKRKHGQIMFAMEFDHFD